MLSGNTAELLLSWPPVEAPGEEKTEGLGTVCQHPPTASRPTEKVDKLAQKKFMLERRGKSRTCLSSSSTLFLLYPMLVL